MRLAPSFTNPSMWRCVAGSTFFTDELCNPGDRHMLALGDQVKALDSTIEDLGLSNTLTGKLSDRATKIGQETGQPPAACSDLTGMIKDVFVAVGGAKPQIMVAQAGGLTAGANGDRVGPRLRRCRNAQGPRRAGRPRPDRDARRHRRRQRQPPEHDRQHRQGAPRPYGRERLPQAHRPDQGSRRRGRQEGPLGQGCRPAADRGLEDLLGSELLDAPKGGREERSSRPRRETIATWARPLRSIPRRCAASATGRSTCSSTA